MKTVSFFGDHFLFDGRVGHYRDIRHISFLNVVTTYKPVGDEYHNPTYTLSMVDGTRFVQATAAIDIGFYSNTKKAERVVHEYERLSKESYNFRLLPYLNEAKARRFFTYDNKTFHNDGTIDFGNAKTTLRDIESYTVLVFPFRIELHKKNKTAKERIKSIAGVGDAGNLTINTQTDRDVLYQLLHILYGKIWEIHLQYMIKKWPP